MHGGLQTKQLEILNEIARIATSDLELRPLLQRICDVLAAKFDWQFVALAMVDPERRSFVCEGLTTKVPTTIHVGYSRPVGSGIVGEVARTEQPIVVDDVRDYPNYVETTPGTLSEICVPVKHGGNLVAILNLESAGRAEFHDELPLLLTIAEQIAGAIANARLYQELKQRARLMEMMSEVSRTALEATDLHPLIVRICDYIHRHFPAEIVEILLYDAKRDQFQQAAHAGGVGLEPGTGWPAGRGIVGRCMRTGRTQLVLDISTDPEYYDFNPNVGAELVVPIRFHNQLLGVFNLESVNADVFTPANVLAFEAFADQVAGAIHLASVKRDLEEANAALQSLSTTDALTGIANRRRFDELLEIEWRRAARTTSKLALLMIDIDHFKAYNDEHGHQAGDECLRGVASALRDSLHRAADVVARYGGEELAVLLPDTDADRAAHIAEILRSRVATGCTVTISIGVASVSPTREGELRTLVHRADAALYEAKRSGRNRVVVTEEEE